MDINLQITDMAGARPEHSTVIVNFVSAIRQFYPGNIITEENKEKLRITHFPHLNITFDELFAEVDMEY